MLTEAIVVTATMSKGRRKSAAVTGSAGCHLLSPTTKTLSLGTKASATTMLSLAVALRPKLPQSCTIWTWSGKKAKARMTSFPSSSQTALAVKSVAYCAPLAYRQRPLTR